MRKFLLLLALLCAPMLAKAQPIIQVSSYVRPGLLKANQADFQSYFGISGSADLLSYSNYVATNFATSNMHYVLSNYVATNFVTSNQFSVFTNNTIRGVAAGSNVTTSTNNGVVTVNASGGGGSGLTNVFNANQFTPVDGTNINISSTARLTNIMGFGTWTISNIFVTNYVEQKIVTVPYTQTTNKLIDLSAGNEFHVDVSVNNTFLKITNFPTAGSTRNFNLRIRMDGTGGYSVLFHGNILFASGVAPTITTNANARDLFSGIVEVEGTNVMIGYAQDFRR